MGPPDTPYSGYKYELRIDVGDEYPMTPPVIRFVTKCFHPNIHFEVMFPSSPPSQATEPH